MSEIIQTITLVGGDQVTSALTQIGQAGQSAFSQLAAAAATSEGVFAAVSVGIAAIGGALFEFSRNAAEATVEMGHLAKQAGTTIDEMSGLTSALSSLGANTDGLGVAFKRLAFNIANNWSDIKKEVENAKQVLQEDHLKIIESSAAVADAQLKLSQSFAQSTAQIANDQLAVQGATLSVEEAEQRLQTLRGHPPSESAKKQLEIDKAELAVKKAQQELLDAERKLKEDIAKRQIENQILVNNLERSRLELAKAQKKAEEDQEKSLPEIVKGLKEIVAQTQESAKQFDLANHSVNDIAKGIELLASDATGKLPTVEKVFKSLADVFKNTKDETLKMALAVRLFGRGVAEDVVTAISVGAKSLEDYIATMKKLGLVLDENDEKIAVKFHQALNRFSNDLKITSTQLGLLFTPAFTQALDKFDQFLRDNHAAILKWGEAVRDQATEAAKGFRLELDLIKGTFILINSTITSSLALFNNFFGTNIESSTVFAAIWKSVFNVFLGFPKQIADLVDNFTKLFDQLGGFGWDQVKKAWQAFKDFVVGEWNLGISGVLDQIATKIKNLGQSILDLAKKAAGFFKGTIIDPTGGGGGGSIAGGAGGGAVFGPGTSTSDSILARLSNGEFVQAARAVQFYGVDFMHALNRMQIPRGMFATGGLVGARTMSFAKGGEVTGGQRVVNLTIGKDTIAGLIAPEAVAQKLFNVAVRTNMSSAGRKPSWVR